MIEKEPNIQFESEKEPTKERGKDVRIVVSVIRHGEKTTEQNLSELGLEEAKKMGRKKEIPSSGIKGYTSPFERASKTLEAILEGIKKQPQAPRIFKSRVRFELAPPKWEHFEEIIPKAKEIEKKEGEAGLFKYILSEPLMQKDLERWTSSLAFFIDKYIRMGNKLYSHSNIELLHVTHDIVIGDFLRKVAIVKDKEGKRIVMKDLDILGGNIKFLEGFNFEIYLDSQGEKHLKINFRGNELEVDEEKLKDLANTFKKEPYTGRTTKQNWKEK